MATQSLSPEDINYVRFFLAVSDVCTESLRDVLLRNVPSQDIKQAIVDRWGHQYNGPKFSRYPYSVLFPNHQLDPNFSVSDCNLPLLYFLIRNVSTVQQPLLGWGQSCWNNPQDTSIGSNVERLHELRITVTHLHEPRLSNQEFNSYWNKLRDCLTNIDTYLGGTNYQKKLECLKTADMDPDYANRLIESFHSSLQDLQAGQRAQDQTLSDIRGEVSQEFHDFKIAGDRTIEELSEVKDLIKDELQQTATDVKVIRKLMEDMAGQFEHGQTLSDIKEILNQGFLDINTADDRTMEKRSEVKDLIECDKRQLANIAKLMCKFEESKAGQLEQDKTLYIIEEQLNQGFQDIKTADDCMIEKLSEVKALRKDENRQLPKLVILWRKLKSAMDNLKEIHVEMKDKDFASGLDGKLCITKQYDFIKSNLTKESGLVIAECLLERKLLSQDVYDRMGNAYCSRRHSIDILLKKVIHGGKEEIKEAFVKSLKVECPLIARAVTETTITDKDRLRFAQLEERGLETGGPFRTMLNVTSKRDVSVFKYHLIDSEEDVEHITDVMLSRLHFSIMDHSSIIDCPTTEDRISVLFQTMQFYKLDVVKELSDVVKPKLCQKWMESRSTQGSRWSRLYQWMKKSKVLIDGSFKSVESELTDVEKGSIILKFITGVNFSIDLLKPESLKMKIKTLLKRGCLESKTEPMTVAHVTVYIESTPNKDREAIHIYIDFPATDVSIETEDGQDEMRIRNRDIMLEEMNPARLKDWILNQPCIQKSHKDMLESKLSEQCVSRRNEVTVLLDFLNGLENGDHLLEKYCEKIDLYVYNKVYRKHQKSNSQQEEIPGHRAAVTYVKGGGLQKLFSFSITFNDEGIDLDTEEASASAMPFLPTSDKDRFICIVLLLVDVGTKVLRQLLSHHTVTSTCTLDQYLATNMSIITSLRKVFNQSEMNIMFPPNGDDTNLGGYDITLLAALFLNIVSTLNQLEKDLIRRLRETRNKVYGHASSSQISANDFQTYWNDISSLLTALSQSCGDTTFEANILQEIQRSNISTIHDESYLYKLKRSSEIIESFKDELQNELRLQALESNTKSSATMQFCPGDMDLGLQENDHDTEEELIGKQQDPLQQIKDGSNLLQRIVVSAASGAIFGGVEVGPVGAAIGAVIGGTFGAVSEALWKSFRLSRK